MILAHRVGILSLTLVVCVLAQDECDYGSPDNTMCKYKPEGCIGGTLLRHGITDDDIALILRVHNECRNKVALGRQEGQPPATNMQELLWDDEIATIAERWAEQCVFEHDKLRNKKNGEYVGQNIAVWYSTAEGFLRNFSMAILDWYDEVNKPGFNPDDINPYKFTEGTGHYTQMVWANTTRVGCGFAYYKNLSSDGTVFYNNYYVCNYAPGGNVISGVMYKVGTTASDCKIGVSATYDGLCSEYRNSVSGQHSTFMQQFKNALMHT